MSEIRKVLDDLRRAAIAAKEELCFGGDHENAQQNLQHYIDCAAEALERPAPQSEWRDEVITEEEFNDESIRAATWYDTASQLNKLFKAHGEKIKLEAGHVEKGKCECVYCRASRTFAYALKKVGGNKPLPPPHEGG